MQVVFSDEHNKRVNEKVKRFVVSMCDKKQSVDYYEKKRNVGGKKAIEDIYLGKKAEFFAAQYLYKKGFPSIEIDLEVRKGNKKGWKVDLEYPEGFPNVHVKACSQSTLVFCGDYSWTFQYSDNSGYGGTDEIFSGSNDLIALVYADNPYCPVGEIKALLSWDVLKKHLKDPIKKTLVGLKKCIYYEDLLSDNEIQSFWNI